jgi:hypothetical protein
MLTKLSANVRSLLIPAGWSDVKRSLLIVAIDCR